MQQQILAKDAHREVIYVPEHRPGFVAWATAFPYGDGSVGVSFNETMRGENPSYQPAFLEMGEAVGAPVSYGSVECGDAHQISQRVYLRTADNGKTYTETGRCLLEQGSFCNIGFADGRIIGLDVPRINENRTGWCDYIEVKESTDGGTTWQPVCRLLEGCAPYLWRVRRLKDGTILVLACLYGTPWGKGRARTTRNTMLPGETYLQKIQTFFLTSTDGRTYSQPHYILPGVGAHEYDVVECNDGRLLFIAGDVQGTPVARQFVERRADGMINGTLYSIRKGAPPAPNKDPQGGFVPESMAMLENGLIVGSRRNKPYACSNDYGENWHEISGVAPSLYQPFLHVLNDGTIANFGHFGGDSALGQVDMWLGADYFRVENTLPAACTLTLQRTLAADESHYLNAFSAQLCAGDRAVAGETVLFRCTPVWNTDGSVNTTAQENAPVQISAVTDANGVAVCEAPMFNGIIDIHFYYNIDVVYRPAEGSAYSACDGPMMCVAALTPHRCCRHPYPAYFAEGTLFVSPSFLEKHPDLFTTLAPYCQETPPTLSSLPENLAADLISCHALKQQDGKLVWHHSTHAERPLAEVKAMDAGDWYL